MWYTFRVIVVAVLAMSSSQHREKGSNSIMPRMSPTRRRAALAVAGIVLAVTALGCAKAPFRDVINAGDDVRVAIDDPDGVDSWAVRTTSDADVVVVRLSGDRVDALMMRVLLPGGVVVAELSPPRGTQFSMALSGRPAVWTMEFRIREPESAPVHYRMQIVRPSPAGPGGGAACVDALGARGIVAWAVSVSAPPAASGLPFPGLGAMGFEATPPGTLAAAPAIAGGAPVVRIGAGTTLRGDFARLGCLPRLVQLNLWDASKGKPPTMSIADAGGRPLCGGSGQAPCLADPSPGRWVPWTLSSSTPIGSFSLVSDEIYLASVVIQ